VSIISTMKYLRLDS